MSINLPPEFIAAGAWLWESFSKDIIKGFTSSTKSKLGKEWEKFEWSLAAKRYREKVYELYSTIRMLGSPFLVPLQGIYTDVYLLDKPTAFRRHNIENLKETQSLDEYSNRFGGKKVDAVKLIQKERRLYVLGKPAWRGQNNIIEIYYIACSKRKNRQRTNFYFLE